jgi:curved DNA-binding protein
MKEYYNILGLSEKSSKEEIKSAYKKLARKYHPDLNPNNIEAEAQFKKLSEAYEVLSNEQKRKAYDTQGESFNNNYNQESHGPYYHESQSTGNSRYQDIFDNLFGRGAKYAEDDYGNFQFKGEDYNFRMEVSFQDIVLGAKRKITLPNNKNFEVQTPPGIKHGQKLRFKGQGGKGQGGAPSGDMFIEVSVKETSEYIRRGNNLEYSLSIPFSTAILGGKAQVPCLDGSIEITIPEETNTGTKLRIKGKGIRISPIAGDLFIKIKVSIPKNIPSGFKKELSKWKEEIEALR